MIAKIIMKIIEINARKMSMWKLLCAIILHYEILRYLQSPRVSTITCLYKNRINAIAFDVFMLKRKRESKKKI